jgi:VWFA-related protein
MPFAPRFVSLLLGLLILPGAASSAQAPQTPSGQQSASRQMTIHVSVDSHARIPVEGLTQDDFSITDNKKPQPITGFRAVKNVQTKVIIVLDAVNLSYVAMSFGREQLAQFFSADEGHLRQPTTLAILQDSGLQIQPAFTTDGNELRSLLDKYTIGLRNLRRSAGIYGADERLQICLRAFEGLVADNLGKGPTRIIWISPGWPLLSGPGIILNPSQETSIFNSVIALTTEMRRSDIVIDAVNPLGASEDVARTNYYENFLRAPRKVQDVNLADVALQVLATDSGGLVLNGSNDIAGLLQHAVAQSTQAYELTFNPAPGDRPNEYHDLQVKLRRSGLNVHTITGYYAHPVYPPFIPAAVTPVTK